MDLTLIKPILNFYTKKALKLPLRELGYLNINFYMQWTLRNYVNKVAEWPSLATIAWNKLVNPFHTCLAALVGCFRKLVLIVPSTGRLFACTLLLVLGSTCFTLRWAGILFSWSSYICVEDILTPKIQSQDKSPPIWSSFWGPTKPVYTKNTTWELIQLVC